MFAGTCPLDILVKLLLEVVLELGTEVGGVEEDGVGELALRNQRDQRDGRFGQDSR